MRRVVGTAARLVPVKGLLDLVRAFAVVRAELVDARLEIAGAGFDRPRLEREVELMALTPAVTFLGWRSIFSHDHESVGAQPLDELVFLIALLLPHWRRGWQTGVDHHFDQIASGARAGQKIPQLQPIEAASGGADRASNIRLIDEHQDSGT